MDDVLRLPIMSEVIMRRASPDQSLHLILVQTGAVLALGFEESPWHVHPDDIADLYYDGQTSDAEDMLHRFVADIVDDRLVIEVEFSRGSLVNAMVCNEHDLALPTSDPCAVQRRYWSGRSFPGVEKA